MHLIHYNSKISLNASLPLLVLPHAPILCRCFSVSLSQPSSKIPLTLDYVEGVPDNCYIYPTGECKMVVSSAAEELPAGAPDPKADCH
jgi:hypothetical protein